MYNSTLKPKKSLRDSYAEKIKNGEKNYKGMKQGNSLQANFNSKSSSKKKSSYKPKAPRSVSKKYMHSIFTDNLNRCMMTGDTNDIHIHHIYGAANKENSEKYGFLLPLRADWHNMADYGIHFNRELECRWKKRCQEYWLEHYGSKEEFIEIFGKWWE